MITVEEADKLKRAIRKLVLAEIANSYKGGGYKEDIPLIEEELKAARIRVSVIIAQMSAGSGKTWKFSKSDKENSL